MAVKKIEYKELIDCAGKNVEFLQCNISKPLSDFFDSWSPYNITNIKKLNKKTNKQEYLCKTKYCKECLGKIYTRYKEEFGTAEKALFYTCQMANIPFIAEKVEATFDYVSSEAKRGSMVKNIFGTYYSNLLKETSKHHLWQDFSCTDIDYKDIASHIEKRDIQKKDAEQLELDWGKQKDLEDYALLDYWFDSLTGNKPLSTIEELTYRDLCIAMLTKRKLEQYNIDIKKDANNQDIAKIQTQINSTQTRITNLMKTLKIDNFEEKKEQTIVERMLESRIAIQEKEKPTMYYEGKKEHEDYLGKSKYFHDHIYRPVMNQFATNKLYDIIPKETDDLTDEEYEDKMLNKKFNNNEEE